MGGKPKKNTPADMRLKVNQQKYGNIANRDVARKGGQPGATPAQQPIPRKDGK